MKFFGCKHCGNMVGLIQDRGIPMLCCGEKLAEYVPNTVEASSEKHLPQAAVSGSEIAVVVGSAPHPMTEDHHISFVYVETQLGGMRRNLAANGVAKASFAFTADNKPVAAYAYCNLHGMWKTEIK